MGLAERFIDCGQIVRRFTFYTEGRHRLSLDLTRNGTRFGFMLDIPQHETEGLLRANASVPHPEVALHVGLVASPGTEGCRDFLGQLTGSGIGFRVSHVKVPVQGPGAPALR